MRCKFEGAVGAILISLLLVLGCGGPSLERPELTPAESSAKAIDQYDSDGDGAISEEEAEAAPGLAKAFPKIDKDSDGEITAEEIEARIVYYQTATSYVVPGSCKVTYKRKPLAGANVTFEPEEFLGPSFKPCVGVTDPTGAVFVTDPNGDLPGIYVGFYRVRISKEKENGDEMIPAKYNTETILGFEANNDVPDDASYSDIEFNLK